MPILLTVAATGAIARSIDGSGLARAAGVIAATILCLVAASSLRGRRWAYGVAFFLGLCWLWAAVALRVQGVIAAPEIFIWLVWSILLMVGSIRARTA